MNLRNAKILANETLIEYGLTDWQIKIDGAVTRCGYCEHSKRRIGLSRHYVELNNEASVKNTILHEVAHALVGYRHGHNVVWQMKARAIGCSATRLASPDVVMPEGKITLYCPKCGYSSNRHRRPRTRLACGDCCRQHNGGKFSADYLLKIK